MRNLSLDGRASGEIQRSQGLVAQDGVVEEAELRFGGLGAGDDEAGDPVAISAGALTSPQFQPPPPSPRQPFVRTSAEWATFSTAPTLEIDILHPLVTHRLVLRRVGPDLGAVQRYTPQVHQSRPLAHRKHLQEQA